MIIVLEKIQAYRRQYGNPYFDMKKQAILFVCHSQNEYILKRFQKLKIENGESGRCISCLS